VTPNWTVGFEIELLAPRGRSRLDLAQSVARHHGGAVQRFFHPQSEPSKVAGKPSFENLTPGFEVLDGKGRPIARFVDDMTLLADLDGKAPPLPGWYRIVTDDRRLLRLIMRHCDAAAPIERVLAPIAALFGTQADIHPSGMVKIVDDRGASVAIAAPLPGAARCRARARPISTSTRRRSRPRARSSTWSTRLRGTATPSSASSAPIRTASASASGPTGCWRWWRARALRGSTGRPLARRSWASA
jgi:hypothetical protein